MMTPEYRDALIECSLRYLEEVRDLAVRHRATAEYIRSLEEDAQGIGGVDYSRDLVSKTADVDRLPNSVALLIEMKRDAEASAAEYAELQAQVDRLTAERDNLADDLLACNREREHLRMHLGIALDHAHDMLALVDMDGNVYDYGD